MKRRVIRRRGKAKQKQNLAEPEKQLTFWLRFISASGIICNGARATCGGWHFPNREVIEFYGLNFFNLSSFALLHNKRTQQKEITAPRARVCGYFINL